MCAFEVTHPDTLTPENKLDDIIYSHTHDVEGQADLNQLPQSVQDLIESLGNKKLLGYELIEKKELAAGTTSCTFSNLHGDSDIEYLLQFTGILNITDSTLLLRFNNSATGYLGSGSVVRNGLTTYQAYGYDSNGLPLAGTPWSNTNPYTFFESKLIVKSGNPRLGRSSFVQRGTYGVGGKLFSTWGNTSDEVTSLVIVPANGSFSGIMTLYKKFLIE